MADNKVEFELELITQAFANALNDAAKQVEAFGKDFSKTEKDGQKAFDGIGKAGKDAGKGIKDGAEQASGAWDTFKGVLGAEAVVGAFNLITGAAKSLFNALVVEGVNGAVEAEASLNRLKSTLSITGEATSEVVGDFQAFAAQMQKNTAADGDNVLSQLALAKQYGLTNEQAKQVVTTATDMAARGYDADTAVKQLSESFSGQAGRLAKLNPALKNLTEEQLKAGAGAALMAAQFAGSAADKLNTYETAIAQASNAFGDMQEEIGFLITQNPAIIAAIQQAVGIFQELTAWVSANSDEIGRLIADGLNVLVTSISTVISIGSGLVEFFRDNAVAIESLAVGLGVAAIAWGAYALVVNASAIATGVAAAAQWVLNAAMAANPVGLVILAIAGLAAGVYYLAQNWDLVTARMAGFAAAVLQYITPAINAVLDHFAAIANIFDEDLARSILLAKETMVTKTDELLVIQAEGEEAAREQARIARETKETEETAGGDSRLLNLQTNYQAQVLALQNKQTTENGMITGDNATKAQERSTALLTESEQLKAAEKAKKEQDLADKTAQKELEKKHKQELAAIDKEAADKKKKDDKEAKDEASNRETSLTDAINNEYTIRKDFAALSDREKVANFRSTLGEISSLQSSSNAELFEVGKIAAIADASLRTYQAANVALASAPPPFNFALAAAVTTAGLLNVRKIQSTQRSAGSFEDGGIVGGSSFTGDRLTANVNSREGIFTVQQQKRLFDMANGGGANSDALLSRIDSLEQAIRSQPVVVQIEGESIATAVRAQVRSGFSLGGE